MNKTLRKILIAVLALAVAVCGGMLICRLAEYRQGEQTYSEAAELVGLPDLTIPEAPVSSTQPEAAVLARESEASEVPDTAEEPMVTKEPVVTGEAEPQPGPGPEPTPEPAPEPEPEPTPWVDPYADALSAMDFTALRQVNDDVLGWIVIPGTNLSYPLLQGEDNDYYLNHTWRRWKNAVGGIFVDYRCSWDLSDFHTVIYGHRMNNSSMFGQLHKYKDAAWLAEHPTIYIADDTGSHAYRIFAVYEADSGLTYRLDLDHDGTKQGWIEYCLGKSILDTGVVPGVEDRIITLSTCTGNGHEKRWVVQAVLDRE